MVYRFQKYQNLCWGTPFSAASGVTDNYKYAQYAGFPGVTKLILQIDDVCVFENCRGKQN